MGLKKELMINKCIAFGSLVNHLLSLVNHLLSLVNHLLSLVNHLLSLVNHLGSSVNHTTGPPYISERNIFYSCKFVSFSNEILN
ncbi:hypothetical protein HYPBUDRAFT_195293 [Hyphopichia burtonii NRRL Y-1933]|uniref:Uncharacterized protein n=1 Tax=Hyphopichia burtonii NRRL Y-1933 TaxID=984485 RepID=A0A1E4RBF3_9ASCO|nr:hypothetical protein HYPBUDRAFT_195293 [Hyphopichia burtonii NRRL Y-1933]ODV64579.1 hypothetical protein HYPBUDRAFT_195293 [Hyphopichia burtonii NRRL Y-1933]